MPRGQCLVALDFSLLANRLVGQSKTRLRSMPVWDEHDTEREVWGIRNPGTTEKL